MQVSVESISTLERRMEVQVPAERVEQAVDERLARMSRTVRLKGFRPGKVPVKVVRQQFGDQVRQEVLGDVMQTTFNEAITQENLTPAAGPRIEPISLEQGADLKYRAVFEVVPQVELKGLDALPVARPVAEVTDADVDAMIQNLREQRPTYSDVERAAQDTDRVIVDFVGTIDGEAFEGGSGEGVPVDLGAGRMLKEFEAGLAGASAGETKTIELTFPENYGASALAGKQASFAVTVKSVQERQLPELDDEFCAAYGVDEGGIERLRAEVRENMERELAEAIRGQIKNQIFDELLKAHELEVPKSMVESQVREMQMDAGRRMGARDVSQLPAADSFQDAAKRRVTLSLLVGEVIREGKLEVDQQRVQARFEEFAQQLPDDERTQQQYRTNPQFRRQLEAVVLEEQVIDWVLTRAKVTDTPATFKEIMKFGA